MQFYKSFSLLIIVFLFFGCEQEADHRACAKSIESLQVKIDSLNEVILEQKALVRLEATKGYKCSKELEGLKERLKAKK